jgi:hypothetical protein
MTSDGGNTFTLLTKVLDSSPTGSTFPQTTVGAVALNPASNPPQIFLATGEGNQGDSFWGDGIFTSSNLGSTWAQIAGAVSIEGGYYVWPGNSAEGFTKLAVDNHSPPYVYAAATWVYGANRAAERAYLYQTTPGMWGLWRSTDGGSTFTQYPVSEMGGCMDGNTSTPCPADDVVIDPATGYVFAAVDTYGIFRSTDSGATFSAITLPGVTNGQVGRSSIAAYGGTIYVMVGSSDMTTYLGFFKSTDSGSTWTQEKVPCEIFRGISVIDGTATGANSNCGQPPTPGGSQSFYDQALAIQPGGQGNTVVFGGVGLYLSADSGQDGLFSATIVPRRPRCTQTFTRFNSTRSIAISFTQGPMEASSK